MVFEKLCKIVADQFGVSESELTMDTNFIEDLDADSLDLVEVMMSVEETFHIDEIVEEELQSLKTMGDVVNYISDRI